MLKSSLSALFQEKRNVFRLSFSEKFKQSTCITLFRNSYLSVQSQMFPKNKLKCKFIKYFVRCYFNVKKKQTKTKKSLLLIAKQL